MRRRDQKRGDRGSLGHGGLHSSVYKRFAAVAIGDPLLPDSNHGPLADEAQSKQVQAYIESGKKSGKMSLGAETIDQDNGFFVRSTVFLETQEDASDERGDIWTCG